MRFIIYMDEVEIFIATPESEVAMVEHNFQGEILRRFKDYQRFEFDADYLVGAVYDERVTKLAGIRLGIEGNLSRKLYLADRPMPVRVSLEKLE